MIFTGSSAIKHWIPSFRTPQDKDIILVSGESKPDGYDAIYLPQDIVSKLPTEGEFLTLDAILTLKMSHMGWDIKWNKHKNDVIFLKNNGAKVIEELYKKLVEFWKQEHKNKPYLSLYKTKAEFFDDYVPHVYDHDYLHELISCPRVPIYTKCLGENQQVALDYEKFKQLPLHEQLLMFREEMCVIALERWIVNDKLTNQISLFKAYKLALHKTTTALTKNWACDFIINNIEYYNIFQRHVFEYALKTLPFSHILTSTVDIVLWFSCGHHKIPFDVLSNFIIKQISDDMVILQIDNKFYQLEYDIVDGFLHDNNCMCYEVKPVQKTITTYI